MAAASLSSNKAKIARRVVEVLEYFDDDHRQATVMDIVRRYNRPQSSTSELLSSLVELGLLHKDPFSRSYSLAPRAALLGTTGQSGMTRDGQLMRLVDRLVAQTGLAVGLFGIVGLNSQVIGWYPGPKCHKTSAAHMHGGMQEPLSESASGWLMLSTIAKPRRDGMLRRLNAEANDLHKFQPAEMASRIDSCHELGYVRGPAGFGSRAELLGVLLPGDDDSHPLVVGFVYDGRDIVNVQGLLACLDEAIRHCIRREHDSDSVRHFPTAA